MDRIENHRERMNMKAKIFLQTCGDREDFEQVKQNLYGYYKRKAEYLDMARPEIENALSRLYANYDRVNDLARFIESEMAKASKKNYENIFLKFDKAAEIRDLMKDIAADSLVIVGNLKHIAEL